jgi:hypothetical protein
MPSNLAYGSWKLFTVGLLSYVSAPTSRGQIACRSTLFEAKAKNPIIDHRPKPAEPYAGYKGVARHDPIEEAGREFDAAISQTYRLL